MTLGDRLAQRVAHERLPPSLTHRGGLPPTTHGRHRFGHGIERRRTVAAVLDDVVPPTLWVGVAGGCGQRRQRVAHRMLGQLQLTTIAAR